ncbi:carbohydrate esterase family 2 protein [Lophiostoma macrostomum CBS 122681]|uniref:Carbohydrate esterase family 2 protein n=1 Tax=Lophiostoma macrostomum CBS 122681 TaxID=1314788 RepID=A0A6A6TD63_9PLEO|nr:carbohydrate esterase family 2 protein [Lophiostoma macrostomum CBS 122681]
MGLSIRNLIWLASAVTVAARSITKRTDSISAPFTNSTSARYVGRVNPATNELSWPSTGVTFAFTGTTASISFSGQWGTTSAALFIDGAAPIEILAVNGSVSTPTLAQGTHTVTLRKRSEAYMGSLYVSSITTDGTLSTLAPATRRIEIIGDSISVGYGLDGVLPCTNSPELEDNPKTYGALAADALHADYSVVAWSGKGIIRNYADGSTDVQPVMPEMYTRYGANDADNTYTYPSSWTPDAIVINLGTNDFSYLNVRSPLNATAYTNALVAFVNTIQGHYPKAQFFLVGSPMLSDNYPTVQDAQKSTQTASLKSAVATLNGNGTQTAHFVDWPVQGADVGCDYHPNNATHAAEGKVLAEAIGQALHW